MPSCNQQAEQRELKERVTQCTLDFADDQAARHLKLKKSSTEVTEILHQESASQRTWKASASSMDRRHRAKTRARRPGLSDSAGLTPAQTDAQRAAAEERRRRRPIAAIAGTPRISSRYLEW